MINIYYEATYPGCELSNLARHPFELDGIKIESMEGFLQSLKYFTEEKQKIVCKLSGEEARNMGKYKVLWKFNEMVNWRGRGYDLFSDELQQLIDRAYEAMYEQSEEFRSALVASGKEPLVYRIGEHQMNRAIITEYHLVRRLEKLRQNAIREFEKSKKDEIN